MTDSRFGSIGDILSRRVLHDAETEQTPEGPEDTAPDSATVPPPAHGTITRIDDAATAGRTRPHRVPQLVADAPASGSESTSEPAPPAAGARRVVFRIDPDLHRALVNRAMAEKVSYGHVVLDAVEATHLNGQLDDLLASTASHVAQTGLFPRLKPRTDAQPAVSVEIRLAARAVEILDQLVIEHGAENRTHLMVAALGQYLT